MELSLGTSQSQLRAYGSRLAGRPTWVPLVSATGHLVIEDMKKPEVLNAVFGSVFISKTSLQKSQAPSTRVKTQSKEDLLLVQEDQVRESLNKLNIPNKSWENWLISSRGHS